MSMALEEQYDRIYRYCYYKLHDVQQAEDITQETFLRYLEYKKYKDIKCPLAFLYTVARNLCMDWFRRQKTQELSEELAKQLSTEEAENHMLDSVSLRQALLELEERERELVLLRFVNEVPVSDLSKIYKVSRFALYRETKKILKKLERRILDEE